MSGKNLATGPETIAPPAIECRVAPRQRILQRCFIRPPETKGPEGWRCIAYNISVVGIGLALPFRLAEGTMLEILPWELAGSRPLRARVIRGSRVDSLWFCGCEFVTPLDEKELRLWTSAPRDWLPPEPRTPETT